MSRAVSSSFATALTAATVFPAFFVSCQFLNETIYVWSGLGTVTWNGQTWQGVGSLGSISPLSEASTVEAQGITLTLTGITADLLTDSLTQLTTGGAAQVYFALYDSSGNQIASPVPAFIGLMDQAIIDMGTDTVTITISVENRLSDLNRARGGRLTDQDQKQRHPNDNGLQFVSLLQDKFINWHS